MLQLCDEVARAVTASHPRPATGGRGRREKGRRAGAFRRPAARAPCRGRSAQGLERDPSRDTFGGWDAGGLGTPR
eukprot:gene5674-7452_t